MAHQALMGPARHKYLSSINFIWLKHVNVSDIHVFGYHKIVDYTVFQFVNRTSDIFVRIKALISNLRDVDAEFPPRNSLKIACDISVGWSFIFVLFALKTSRPDTFKWSVDRALRSCAVEVRLVQKLAGEINNDLRGVHS